MLSKKYRLTREQINLIYKRGRGRNFGALGIKFRDNNEAFSRFAIVVPKAVEKKAVGRNRLRRVAYDEIGTLIQAGRVPLRDIIIRFYQAPDSETGLRKALRKIFEDV